MVDYRQPLAWHQIPNAKLEVDSPRHLAYIEQKENNMTRLAIKTKTTHHVDWLTYSHVNELGQCGLNDLVDQVYGRSFDYGSANDTDHVFDIKKEPIADYDAEVIADIVKRGFIEEYQLDLIMTDMCNRGHLDAGTYVVSVSW